MGLIGINPVSSKERKPTTLEQIALGIRMATDILGATGKAYETFGPGADETKARTELLKAQTADYGGDKELDRMLKRSTIAANMKNAGVESEQKNLNLQKSRMEFGKAQEEQKFGKKLSENTIEELSAGQQVPKALGNLYELIDKNADIFGPVQGRIAALNPYDTRTQTVRSRIKSDAQTVGKYLEGGVLRKEDVPKYEAMLPNLDDTPEVARNKAATVASMIKDKFENTYKNLKGSGYDVRAFEAHPLVDLEIPDFMDVRRATEKLPGAQMSRPKRIVQNGHTYILNESTGEYE